MSANQSKRAPRANGTVLGAGLAIAMLAACSESSVPLPDRTEGPSSGAPALSSEGGSAPNLSQSGSGNHVQGGAFGQGGSAGTPADPPAPDVCGGALPAAFTSTCGACHTVEGAPNPRYPDLYQFEGTLDAFRRRIREGSREGMPAYSTDLLSDSDAEKIFAYFTGGNVRRDGEPALGSIAPLFTPADAVNPPIVFERDDGVLVTRGAGRVRGRHEGPLDTNQPFMEFVAGYFVSRTYGWIVEDYTPLGQSKIRVTYLPISRPTSGTNFRAWKDYANGDVFHANMGMSSEAPLPSLNHGGRELATSYQEQIAPYALAQQQETSRNARDAREIQAGDLLEFEFGIFMDPEAVQPPGSRTSYYTDTFRYRVGKGGVTADNPDPYSGGKGISGPAEAAQQGGGTTNVWAYFMLETQFGQMALNIQHENVQHFVDGRRLFHTDFTTGAHTESGNPAFPEQRGKAGPLGIATSCEGCHVNNGPGESFAVLGRTSSMVIKLYGEDTAGNQLQLADGSARVSDIEEKTVELAEGTSVVLTKPTLDVAMKDGRVPAFSARIARKVIGLGLLEAIDERTILARADMLDCDGDGISGRPSYVRDPRTRELRVGRYGWKAEKVDIEHQVAEALHDDMGVGTHLFPDVDKSELDDADLARLVTYMRLVSVPGQRDRENPRVRAGEQIFQTIGCAQCHVTDVLTGANHPFSELRAQSIKPYTDLLLHDMGPELADASNSASPSDASAPPSASEWRTPPLWGIGLLASINGRTGLLHDGRAANVLEAILWHGGEAEPTRERVTKLPADDRAALLEFVMSL